MVRKDGGLLQVALHEYAHCVTAHVSMQFDRSQVWLWEAIALYYAGQFRHPANVVKADKLPGLSAINSDSTLAYAFGYVLMEYVLKQWGVNNVRDLLLEKGHIENALGITQHEFEQGWHRFLLEKYYK